MRDGVTDLSDLRVEISSDLEIWRHNNDGGAAVTQDFPTPSLPGAPFQTIRTEALAAFDAATNLYFRITLP
ncbi:MAG: hypothetical protein CMI18_14270 [Opitutaceae bacterium]|nr:hypothetical protein [Opitutaceae bacterium]